MANLYRAPTKNFVSTTLNGAINDSVTTITLTSTSNLQSPGVIVIDREDSSGTATPSAREVVSYTGISGSDLTGCTRGAEGSTARSHSDGALVETNFTIGTWNDLRDALATVVNADGQIVYTGTASISRGEFSAVNITSTASIAGVKPVTAYARNSGTSSYGNVDIVVANITTNVTADILIRIDAENKSAGFNSHLLAGGTTLTGDLTSAPNASDGPISFMYRDESVAAGNATYSWNKTSGTANLRSPSIYIEAEEIL